MCFLSRQRQSKRRKHRVLSPDSMEGKQKACAGGGNPSSVGCLEEEAQSELHDAEVGRDRGDAAEPLGGGVGSSVHVKKGVLSKRDSRHLLVEGDRLEAFPLKELWDERGQRGGRKERGVRRKVPCVCRTVWTVHGPRKPAV